MAKTNKEGKLEVTQPNQELQTEVLSQEDVTLIADTIKSIKEIFDTEVTQTYTSIGNLLVEKIYDNKIELIDFSKNPDKSKGHKQDLFKQLTRDITQQTKTGAVLPAKTFLYNSIKLVIDQKQLEHCKEYKCLSISHKIELLSVENIEEKIALAQQISQEQLSVRSTRELVYEKQQATNQDLLYFIKNLDEINNFEEFVTQRLDQLVSDKSSIKSAKIACKKRLEHAEARITTIQKEIETHKEHKIKLEALAKQLEKKESSEATKKKNKSKN